MAGFLYYIEEGTLPIDDECVASLGMRYAFEREACGVESRRGPGGRTGIVFADDRRVPPAKIRFDAELQTWQQMFRGGADIGLWAGFYRDDPPTPETLERSTMLDGHMVTLGDGQPWQVPIAQAWTQPAPLECEPRVPHRSVYGPDGNWTLGAVVPRYAELWALAQRWWDSVAGAMISQATGGPVTVTLDVQDMHHDAATALAVNYVLGPVEITLLELFEPRLVRHVLEATIDWPVLEDWLKKKLVRFPMPDSDGPADG